MWESCFDFFRYLYCQLFLFLFWEQKKILYKCVFYFIPQITSFIFIVIISPPHIIISEKVFTKGRSQTRVENLFWFFIFVFLIRAIFTSKGVVLLQLFSKLMKKVLTKSQIRISLYSRVRSWVENTSIRFVVWRKTKRLE